MDAAESGLGEVNYAKCEDLKSISELHLIHRLGEIRPDVRFEIGRVLRILLEL